MDEKIISQRRLWEICSTHGTHSSSSVANGVLLPTLLWTVDARTVLEIGVLRGFTALAIGLQMELMMKEAGRRRKSERRLFLCDTRSEYIFGAVKLLHEYAPSIKTIPVCGDSTKMEWGEQLQDEKARFDLVHIDGNHDYAAVKRDLSNVLPHIAARGCILLHDYFPPDRTGVVQAIDETCSENPDWLFIPLLVKCGAPVAIMTRAAPEGLPKRR